MSKVAQSFDSQKLCGVSTIASLQAAEFETRELRATRLRPPLTDGRLKRGANPARHKWHAGPSLQFDR
jgi:hypothetical protein